jgi:hypothetical protein
MKNNTKKTNFILFVSSLVMLFSFSFHVAKVGAAMKVIEIGLNLATDVFTTIETTMDTVLSVVEYPMAIKDYIQLFIDRYGMPAVKQSAIKLSNAITQKIVGGNGSGNPQFVQDWNQYLYTDPSKKGITYMNSFYDQTTRGQLGNGANGAGGSYSQYMVSQAKQGIQGSSCDVSNIQNYASNPSQVFADGNMRGLMAYTQPCGNPYSYSTIALNQYHAEVAKQTDLARSQTSNGGWLPQKKNGQIIVPGNLFSSALEGADQMGNSMIVNAKTMQELATAMAFRTGASLMKYEFGLASKSSSSNNNYSFLKNN